MNDLSNTNGKCRRMSQWPTALLLLPLFTSALPEPAASGAELVPLSPAEQQVLSTEYSAPSTQIVASLQSVQCPGSVSPRDACPGSVSAASVCPNGACPIPPAPRSPRQYSAPSLRLSAATFDTVVKLSADNQCGSSGVLVECEGHAVILTAEHVVRGATSAIVTFRDGQQFTSREILVDRGRLDLAAVVIEWPRQIRPAVIGNEPRAGDTVVACGYGMDDTLAGLPNTIRGVRYSRLGAGAAEPDSLEMLGTFRSGDSGGPVFNLGQQVVAIVNASSAPGAANQSNVAVGCRPIRAFLTRLRERFKGRRQKPEGRSEGKLPGEIAPGISIPQVELPAEGSCPCDPTAPQRILQKLEELDKQFAARNAEGKTEQSATRTDITSQLEKLQVAISGDVSRQQHVTRETIVAAIAERAPAAGMTAGKLVAAALGLSTPVGLGIGAAGWLLGRRLKRRFSGGATPRAFENGTRRTVVKTQTSDSALGVAPPLNVDRTVILETPPPPQVVERSQQFVPYQANSARLDALERAMAEYVRKYPSAAGVFETINVYANQFQSGEKK